MEFPTKEEYEGMSLEERKEVFKEFLRTGTVQSAYSQYANVIERSSFTEDNFFNYINVETLKNKFNEIKSRSNYEEIKEYGNGIIPAAFKKYIEFAEQINQIVVPPGTGQTLENQNFPLNQILYGPPGTGKTYNTINKALAIIKGIKEEYLDKEDRTKLKEEFKELSKTWQIVFTTFHQSMSYEDFVEGIKPKAKNSQINYEMKNGIFKEICEKAQKNSGNNYVLIIDEINRGNVSQIFGELITLIEEDKRLGEDEELKITLPYSKSEFGVPKNLYIIGTMNTADRSVEALDTALRRRFSFTEMMPDYELLKDKKINDIELDKLLETINGRIEKLLDREHQIGHSYFLLIKNLDDLKQTFKDKIIPLLQEYFFGDYGKIGLVLGKEFVEKIPETKFAKFDDYESLELEEKVVYRLKDSDNFKSIYE